MFDSCELPTPGTVQAAVRTKEEDTEMGAVPAIEWFNICNIIDSYYGGGGLVLLKLGVKLC